MSNINKKLFRNLLIPGVLGSITGAYLLSDFIDGNVIKPYISIYMIILGIIIIRKALQKNIVKQLEIVTESIKEMEAWKDQPIMNYEINIKTAKEKF